MSLANYPIVGSAAMKYRIRHTTKYAYTEPAPVCQNIVHLAPRVTPRQRSNVYRLLIAPEPATITSRTDFYGNRVDYFAIHEAHRGLAITATSEVEVIAAPATDNELPELCWENLVADVASGKAARTPDVVQHRFASPFVPLSPTLADYARCAFTPGRPVLDALRAFTRQIHRDFRFDPAVTNVSTPVLEVFERRAGVCQDFAHLQIACLRSLGLAARYVSGYLRTIPPPGKSRLVGADASHAWVSVYCGYDRWVEFDPTNDVSPSLDHITVAYGRDYGDVCPIQGVFIGGGQHSMSVAVDVVPEE